MIVTENLSLIVEFPTLSPLIQKWCLAVVLVSLSVYQRTASNWKATRCY